MLKKYLNPRTRILGIIFLLLVCIVASQWQEHRLLHRHMDEAALEEAKFAAMYVRDAIMELLFLTPGAGTNIDPFVEGLNRHGGIEIRMVHSPSINAEYGFEEDEQPETEAEKKALARGVPQSWETRDFFMHVLPMKAQERCQKCHHLPPDFNRPVPIGYTVGLVVAKIPAVHHNQNLELLRRHSVLAVVLAVAIFLVFGYAIYGAIKDLERVRSMLVRQEKLASIGILSAGVAHEILNPLNIISTIAQLRKLDKLPEEYEKDLDEIMAQINRAVRITNNLRMFAHQGKTEIITVDVHALFDRTAGLIEPNLQLDNILIERIYDESLPVIHADEDQLARIFLNLLNNARDAMSMKGRRGGVIKIRTKSLGDGIEIRFSDNGPGIPKEIINKIFDPFFSTKDPGEGTGLGLSMAHSIIEKHGGTITVESEEGKGATFIITLPLSPTSSPETFTMGGG